MPAVVLVNPNSIYVCKPEILDDPDIPDPETPGKLPPIKLDCGANEIKGDLSAAETQAEKLAKANDVDVGKVVITNTGSVFDPTTKTLSNCFTVEIPKLPPEVDTGEGDGGGGNGSGSGSGGSGSGSGSGSGGSGSGSGGSGSGSGSGSGGSGNSYSCPPGSSIMTAEQASVYCSNNPAFRFCTVTKTASIDTGTRIFECYRTCHCSQWENIDSTAALNEYKLIHPNSFGHLIKPRYPGVGCPSMCYSVQSCAVESYKTKTLAYEACRADGNWQCEEYAVRGVCWYWRPDPSVIKGSTNPWDRVTSWNPRPLPHHDIKLPTTSIPQRPHDCKTKPGISQWF